MSFASLQRLAVIVLLLTAALFSSAFAQGLGSPGTGLIADQRKVVDDFTARTDEFEKRIEQNAEDDARLVDIRLQLEDVSRQLLTTAIAFRPRLQEINARLEQLGPRPKEDEPQEPDIVTIERQSLASEKAEINSVIGAAESLSIRVANLIDKIGQMRRDLFARLLTKRYDVDWALFFQVLDAFQQEAADFNRSVSTWLRFVMQFKLKSILLATFLALGAAVVLLFGGRRLFGRLIVGNPSIEEPSYLSRLSVAFWSTLLPTVALAVFLTTTYLLYDHFAVLRIDVGKMMTALFIVIGIVFFVHRLGRAVLSPTLPNWRLIAVETRAARYLLWLLTATAFFTGVDVYLSAVFNVLGAPLLLTVGEALAATVLTGIPVILMALVRPYVDKDGRPKSWHPLLRIILYTLGGVTIGSALAGYIGFARFVSFQMVLTGAVLATMYIGFLSARAMQEEGALIQTSLGRFLQRRYDYDEPRLDQIGLVLSIAINLFVLAIGLPLILFLWGVQPGEITSWAYKLASEIRIGTFSFSLIGILTGILVFIFGYFLARWFQRWLDGAVMARGRVDLGVRNSIRTVVGYAGVALAGLLGLSAAGISLSNLALIAGGLSLGIGFGLQNVVSNFVSGLILLAERPFKVGDWIVAGDVQGTVKRISVRATEIETFQRQSMIMPNSLLINAAVGNWTHRNKLGRVDIRVNVAYGMDVKKAHAVLLDIARGHPLVLKNPEPFVLFANFGPAALEFEIRIFLADILNGVIVQNDIRFAILEVFDVEDIEMPSTPRAAVTKPQPLEPEPKAFEVEDASVPSPPADEKSVSGRRRRPRKPDPDGD